jgi:MFS superfamily sulfate permease-like transporter
MLSNAVIGGVLVGVGMAIAADCLKRLRRPWTLAALRTAWRTFLSPLVAIFAGVLCILIAWRSDLNVWLGPVLIVVLTADFVWAFRSRKRCRKGHAPST